MIKMAPSKISVLITSFSGTGLPPTLSLALPPATPITTLLDELDSRLPPSATTSNTRFLLTTLSNRSIPLTSTLPISHYLTQDDTTTTTILPLRLSAPLPGGKGGFGSQLRAAGGRMSKRKKGAAGVEEHGSSRNLDGRRLRTVTEAKALAEYLAIKPEMDRQEKEKRRKRWQEIVETTERRQEEIKYGSRKVGLDGKWVEDREEVGERTREAVAEVMRKGVYRDNLVGERAVGGSGSSADEEREEDDEVMQDGEGEGSGGEGSGSSKATTPPSDLEPAVGVKGKGKGKEAVKANGIGSGNGKVQARKFVGFDEDDEFMSSSDEESEGEKAKA